VSAADWKGVNPVTKRHNVGTCPACREYLWADVDLSVTVSEPALSREGKGSVYADVVIEGMRLTHECRGRGDS
jgi:hypothetical protein